MATAPLKKKKFYPTPEAKTEYQYFDTLGRGNNVQVKVIEAQLEDLQSDKIDFINGRNAFRPNQEGYADQVKAFDFDIAEKDSEMAALKERRQTIPRSKIDKLDGFLARPDVQAARWGNVAKDDYGHGITADEGADGVFSVLKNVTTTRETLPLESEWTANLAESIERLKLEGAIDLSGLISPALSPLEIPSKLVTANIITPLNQNTGHMTPLPLDFTVTLRQTNYLAVMLSADRDNNFFKALVAQGREFAAGKPTMSADEKAAELSRLDAELLTAWRNYEAATRREEAQHVSRKRLTGVPPEVLLWIEREGDWLK